MSPRRRADRPGARTARPVPSAGAKPLNGAAARAVLAGLAACTACFVTAESLPIGLLLAARALTACAQAVFWAVGPVQASELVRPERRGHAVTAVFGGSAAGLVIGLAMGTAIGHLAGWRAAFAALGIAATLGLGTGGLFYARHPRRASQLAVALMGLSLLCLSALGREPAIAIAFLALASLGQSLMTVANQRAVMEHGPVNGTAWYSTAYNIGIASGPLVGAAALSFWGLWAAPLAGALAAAAALMVLSIPATGRGGGCGRRGVPSTRGGST